MFRVVSCPAGVYGVGWFDRTDDIVESLDVLGIGGW